MKKYLFGLGAMLVGAGLMFVLLKGEVKAEIKPEPFVLRQLSQYSKGKRFIIFGIARLIT
mgnify:CR=1 FL=1